MSDDLETRRRRAAWRAAHRGTKELDLLIGRFADANLGAMNEVELGRFEALLVAQEPDLQSWILEGTRSAGTYADLVGAIRRFHGLS